MDRGSRIRKILDESRTPNIAPCFTDFYEAVERSYQANVSGKGPSVVSATGAALKHFASVLTSGVELQDDVWYRVVKEQGIWELDEFGHAVREVVRF